MTENVNYIIYFVLTKRDVLAMCFKHHALRNVLGYKYKYIFEAQVQSTSKYSKNVRKSSLL